MPYLFHDFFINDLCPSSSPNLVMGMGMFDVEVLIVDSTHANRVADLVLQVHDQFQTNT